MNGKQTFITIHCPILFGKEKIIEILQKGILMSNLKLKIQWIIDKSHSYVKKSLIQIAANIMLSMRTGPNGILHRPKDISLWNAGNFHKEPIKYLHISSWIEMIKWNFRTHSTIIFQTDGHFDAYFSHFSVCISLL